MSVSLVRRACSCDKRVATTYRVHLEVPVLTRLVEVNDDFVVRKAEFFEGNVGAVRIRASVIRVEGDLWVCPV